MNETTIALEGFCPIDDAEALTRALLDQPGAEVDWRGCDQIHAAVLQVLLVARPALVGPPRGRFLAEMVDPQVAARIAPQIAPQIAPMSTT